jgi:hypothetical protein
MNLEVIIAAAVALLGISLACSTADLPRLAFWSAFLSMFWFGFALGWWAYNQYHGVF